MTKAIKFNLTLNNHPVRDLEDLQANFNLDDLLEYYQNGLLASWLEVRDDLAAELAKLKEIKATENLTIAIELCKIFQADLSEDKIKAAVYPFEFRLKEIEELKQINEKKFKKEEIIRSYHSGYTKLLTEMEQNAEDYRFLKTAVSEIHQKYLGLFELNLKDFYERYIFDYPLVILTILANENMRSKIMSEELLAGRLYADITNSQNCIASFMARFNSKKLLPHLKNCNTEDEYTAIADSDVFVLNSTVQAHIGKTISANKLKIPFDYIDQEHFSYPYHIKIFAGVTEGYWKDLEPKGKKLLILKMEANNFIRNSNKNGEELKAEDINSKFIILDGIDYKSNNANHTLIYMEV